MHPLRIDTIDQCTPSFDRKFYQLPYANRNRSLYLFTYLLHASFYAWLFICNDNLAPYFFHAFFRLSADASKLQFDAIFHCFFCFVFVRLESKFNLIVESSTRTKLEIDQNLIGIILISHLNVR